MDQELKTYLDAKFAEMDAKFAQARMETDAKFGEVRAEMYELRTELRAEIEKVETNLLGAFHGWARAMEIRVRGVAGITTGFDERLAMAEERISSLEWRKPS